MLLILAWNESLFHLPIVQARFKGPQLMFFPAEVNINSFLFSQFTIFTQFPSYLFMMTRGSTTIYCVSTIHFNFFLSNNLLPFLLLAPILHRLQFYTEIYLNISFII